MTKIIGLTGGIGSGKTTVATQFKAAGIPIYIADEEAKKMLFRSDIVQKIQKEFGPEVFENNQISRSKLAQLVFKDASKLAMLNAIIHPEVKDDFLVWLQSHQQHPWVIREAAILFESGTYRDCDFIITVIAPLEERIKRVMQRDGVDRATVLARIKHQWTDEQRIALSDFVIDNTTQESTALQVEQILKKLSNI